MSLSWQTPRPVAVMGNPNTGKSSLFNALTGLRQKVGNYPGVTVERHTGEIELPEGPVLLVDVPGIYSLSANSPDERVAVDVLAGHFADVGQPEAILVVVDASNLRRNLYLATQLLELDLPVVIALNMTDVARAQGISLDIAGLSAALQAPVIPIVAARREGIDAIRQALSHALTTPLVPTLRRVPDPTLHQDALADKPLAVWEAQHRYAWINAVVDRLESRQTPDPTWGDWLDRLVSHPVSGLLLFVAVMATVFQAVFSWAEPLMTLIDQGVVISRVWLTTQLPPGALTSLLTDGIVAGVGSVIIFLPQILILFALIIVLEDTGYMARAAFLMDHFMRACGLSGQAFIPLLSSFACAVPGIMATRVIPDERSRLVTILVAPFMTCSARLPVYALLIAAFVPAHAYGWFNLQGLVLLGLYALGIVGGIATAWLLKNTVLRSQTPGFLLELPPYRWPNLKSVLYRLWERALLFLTQAGTVIFSVTVVVWALAYFPHPATLPADFVGQQQLAQQQLPDELLTERLAQLQHQQAAAYLDQSFLGQMGQAIAPLFAPLGWDWKVSAAVLASFPAREVVIAVLGTLYAVGSEVDEQDQGLMAQLRAATHANGTPVFTLPMVLGLMVFYAFCLQCAATLSVMRRETNSWRWPLLAWGYMTGLGYGGAWLIFQLFSAS